MDKDIHISASSIDSTHTCPSENIKLTQYELTTRRDSLTHKNQTNRVLHSLIVIFAEEKKAF
jgi:hypothetical protein